MRFLTVMILTTALLGCRSVGAPRQNCSVDCLSAKASSSCPNNCARRTLGISWVHVPIPVPAVTIRSAACDPPASPSGYCDQRAEQAYLSPRNSNQQTAGDPRDQAMSEKRQLEQRTIELENRVSSLIELLNESADTAEGESIRSNETDSNSRQITKTAATH